MAEPILEPDFLEEEHEPAFVAFWRRLADWLGQHPKLLGQAIWVLIGLIVTFGLIAWLGGESTTIPETALAPSPDATSSIDWSLHFTGTTIVTKRTQDVLQPLIGPQTPVSGGVTMLIANAWQQQTNLLALYDYDLATNLRRLERPEARHTLYRQYLQRLSIVLGEAKATQQILSQQRERYYQQWQEQSRQLTAIRRELTATATASLAQQGSYRQSQVAMLTDYINQLDTNLRNLQLAGKLAAQRLQGTVSNEPALLAGTQITPVDNDNLALITGSPSTGHALTAQQRANLTRGTNKLTPGLSQQTITISPTTFKREMVNLRGTTLPTRL